MNDNGIVVTLDTDSNNITLASSFGSGLSASMTKKGSGTLTLSGSNAYTGGAVVSVCTAFLSNSNWSSGTITVSGSSTFRWAIPFFTPMLNPCEDGTWRLAEDYAFCERARRCG